MNRRYGAHQVRPARISGLAVRLTTAAIVVGLLLVVCLPWDVSVPDARAQGAPEGCGPGPGGEGQVYLGAWIPAALDDPGAPRGAGPLGQFEAKAGKGISILQRWEHWGLGPGGRIDIKWLRRVAQAGAFPMVTWVPWDPTLPDPASQTGFLMRDVANGAHDGYIADIASEVA